MFKRNLTSRGAKYGALAAFVCAELFMVGIAAVYSLGSVFGYGPSTPDMGIPIFLLGQVIGALPATILGTVLGGFGGFLLAKFPGTFAKQRRWRLEGRPLCLCHVSPARWSALPVFGTLFHSGL